MSGLRWADAASAGEDGQEVVDAVGLQRLRRDRPSWGCSCASPLRGMGELMRRREFSLPPEALALIGQVERLEGRAEEVHRTLVVELEGVRDAAAAQRREVEAAQAALARDREALEALLKSRVQGFEFIAEAWADYERARASVVGSTKAPAGSSGRPRPPSVPSVSAARADMPAAASR